MSGKNKAARIFSRLNYRPAMPDPKPDLSQRAVKAVEKLTKSEPVKGADLIGNPETARKYEEIIDGALHASRAPNPKEREK